MEPCTAKKEGAKKVVMGSGLPPYPAAPNRFF